MRKLIVVAGALMLMMSLSGCGSSADSLTKDQIKLMNELADAIDKGADKAKLEDISKRIQEVDKKFKDLKLSADEEKKLKDKYNKEGEEAAKKLFAAMLKNPKALMDIKLPFMGEMPKLDIPKIDIPKIDIPK
jgi:peptidoglycan hydrolase CwlO-like protein